MSDLKRAKHVSLATASASGPPPAGNLAIPIFSSSSIEAEFYEPPGEDRQTPHTRDEIYVVAKGSGSFWDGEQTYEVGIGSFIFVPAGQPHRFQDFTNDFGVWVFFYGPEGGDAA